MDNVNKNNKHSTILKVPDELWDKIKNIFPKEKPLKTVGSRPIVPYRKVIDGILCIKNIRMPMEDATQRIWFWFYLSSNILEVE